MIDKIATGMRIERLIYDAGMNKEDFLRKSGLTRNGLWRITTGACFPRCDTLITMSEILGVSTDYILGLENDK